MLLFFSDKSIQEVLQQHTTAHLYHICHSKQSPHIGFLSPSLKHPPGPNSWPETYHTTSLKPFNAAAIRNSENPSIGTIIASSHQPWVCLSWPFESDVLLQSTVQPHRLTEMKKGKNPPIDGVVMPLVHSRLRLEPILPPYNGERPSNPAEQPMWKI